LILFSLMAGLARINRGYAESAHTLGGNGLLVWRRITLPLATPAYAAGASLMLLKIFEDLGTPLMLGIDGMLGPQLLLRLGSAGLSDPALGVSALLLFGASLVVVTLAWSALLPPLGPAIPDHRHHPARWRGGPVSSFTAAVLTIVLGTLALAPHLWLFLTSLGSSWSGRLLPDAYGLAHYQQLSIDTLPNLGGTLAYAAGAGVFALLLGSAFGTLTTQQGTLARIMRFAATALFAVPGVVLALGYLKARHLIDPGLAGWPAWGWLALLLVVGFKQLPFSQRLMALSLRRLGKGELESARNLGSTEFSAHLRITLPALTGALGAVFLLGFLAAIVELSAVLLLLQEPQAPFAHRLFQTLQTPAMAGLGAAQGMLLAGLVGSGLLVALILLRQRRALTSEYPAAHR